MDCCHDGQSLRHPEGPRFYQRVEGSRVDLIEAVVMRASLAWLVKMPGFGMTQIP